MSVVHRSGIDWRYEEFLGTGRDFSYMLLYPECHERLVMSRVVLASIRCCKKKNHFRRLLFVYAAPFLSYLSCPAEKSYPGTNAASARLYISEAQHDHA
jgi:hypothetical protein